VQSGRKRRRPWGFRPRPPEVLGCKPDSVQPGWPGVAIICLVALEGEGSATLRPVLWGATYLGLPAKAGERATRAPAWSCTVRGLPCPFGHPKGGGLLHHLFTLTSLLREAVCFLWHFLSYQAHAGYACVFSAAHCPVVSGLSSKTLLRDRLHPAAVACPKGKKNTSRKVIKGKRSMRH